MYTQFTRLKLPCQLILTDDLDYKDVIRTDEIEKNWEILMAFSAWDALKITVFSRKRQGISPSIYSLTRGL